jgi:acyl-homoserine lactone acylase PvdQ
MLADVHGHTFYARAGRVPRRPASHTGAASLPGWTAASEWLGTRAFPELVQILNPAAGYMQNCNVAPATMMPASPLTADRYPADVYNSTPDRTNARGARVLALLGADDTLTIDEALAIALDTYVLPAERWQRALTAAFAARRQEFAHVDKAVQLMTAWDRRVTIDSRAAALYRFWMLEIEDDPSFNLPRAAIEAGEPLDARAQFELLRSFVHAVHRMEERVRRFDAPWGELHRITRGSGSWPAAGSSGAGLGTLRSIRWSRPDAQGVSQAIGGIICPTVVVLKPSGIVSYSATPFGQSNDPASPHFADQAERLTSKGVLKRNWVSQQDVLANLESRRELTLP